MDAREARSPITRGEVAGPPAVVWRLDGSPDPAAPLVVCLHGMWMDEDFFAVLLQRLFDLPYRFLIPRAPLPVASRGLGKHAASWYDYDGDQDRFRAELLRSESLLLRVLAKVETERGLVPRGRAMLGFSQGGYCGSFVAIRHPEVFRGMIVSGARVKTEFLGAQMRAAAAAGFRVLLCHGERDPAVPREAVAGSRDALAAAGVDVELRSFDAGHSLGKRQVEACGEWLRALFG
jgi:predicted esterase